MKDNIVIFNPSSGNERSIKKKANILNLLKNNKIKYDLFITKNGEELRKIASDSVNKYKNIIGVGGDTTFNMIADELLKFNEEKNNIPSIAMIGTGSANDIIKSIGMYPLKNAVSAIKENNNDLLDIGEVRINEEHNNIIFLGSLSIGLGTTVNRYVDIFNKRHKIIKMTGNFGQFIAGFFGVRRSFKNRDVPISTDIEYKNINRYENISLLVILNTPLYSNGIKFIDNCDPFDGKLNCALIETRSFWETLVFYSRLEKNKKKITNFESDKIKLKFNTPQEIQLDGEIFENIEQLKISIIPKKLKIIVP